MSRGLYVTKNIHEDFQINKLEDHKFINMRYKKNLRIKGSIYYNLHIHPPLQRYGSSHDLIS